MKTRLVAMASQHSGHHGRRSPRSPPAWSHSWPTVVLADWRTVVSSIKMELRGQGLNVIIIPRFWLCEEYGIKKSKQSDRK